MSSVGSIFSFLSTIFMGISSYFIQKQWKLSLYKEIEDIEDSKTKLKRSKAQQQTTINTMIDRCSYNGIFNLHDTVENIQKEACNVHSNN
jgi:hypothetical protein